MIDFAEFDGPVVAALRLRLRSRAELEADAAKVAGLEAWMAGAAEGDPDGVRAAMGVAERLMPHELIPGHDSDGDGPDPAYDVVVAAVASAVRARGLGRPGAEAAAVVAFAFAEYYADASDYCGDLLRGHLFRGLVYAGEVGAQV
ncbi:hypothetical protein BIV57_18005 [Mangrovactinospora gilvigrisea]|uniref:Uncharacterized protein n=1 Tax=Mangrovactinospora gilvigrisea TaxID=1428644 RepID=A0A1J7C3J5_9ACTN|nr:hypothetical protein [Mangrovactinospora gilvigrisea]OIV36132.1 hypothetical protein BIV57_18005 [Mangrovactinospora gilvigrisea]